MTGAVSHSQPAVSEFTWQDLSDASAEEGPNGFVFYNENDKGLDASGDPREATIQPEVGETGGERGGVGRGGGGRGGGGSGGGGSGGERDHDDADASVLHENHHFNSASSLPEEFVGHASVASLVNACVRRLPHNTILLCKSRALNISQRMPPTPPPLLLMMMETLRVVKQLTWVASNSAKSNVIISARSARKLRRSTRHANETSPARSWVVAGISTSGSTNLVAARRSAT